MPRPAIPPRQHACVWAAVEDERTATAKTHRLTLVTKDGNLADADVVEAPFRPNARLRDALGAARRTITRG